MPPLFGVIRTRATQARPTPNPFVRRWGGDCLTARKRWATGVTGLHPVDRAPLQRIPRIRARDVRAVAASAGSIHSIRGNCFPPRRAASAARVRIRRIDGAFFNARNNLHSPDPSIVGSRIGKNG